MAEPTKISKRETCEAPLAERMRAGQSYQPSVDILENEAMLVLLADMPGVRVEDVDIQYERGELSVHGRVRPRDQEERESWVLREYGVGDYYRSFRVGEGVDAGNIKAQLKDGVLKLQLPKTEQMMPRKIVVTAE